MALKAQRLGLVQEWHRERCAVILLEGCTTQSRLCAALIAVQDYLPRQPELGQTSAAIAHVWASVGEYLGHRWQTSVTLTHADTWEIDARLDKSYVAIGQIASGQFYLPEPIGRVATDKLPRSGQDWLRWARRSVELRR